MLKGLNLPVLILISAILSNPFLATGHLVHTEIVNPEIVYYMPSEPVNPDIAPDGGAWWAGVCWDDWGPVLAPKKIYSTMTIPSIVPRDGDFFYVMVSCFDNLNNFIQVGLSTFREYPGTDNIDPSSVGTYWFCHSIAHVNIWGFVEGGYEDEMPVELSRYLIYTFVMEIKNGRLYFSLIEEGYEIYSTSVETGATAFVVTRWMHFILVSILNFWMAEEIHYLETDQVPRTDFKLRSTRFDGIYADAWFLVYWSLGTPPGVTVTISRQPHYVLIDNS
jgi:hypothetical protein